MSWICGLYFDGEEEGRGEKRRIHAGSEEGLPGPSLQIA